MTDYRAKEPLHIGFVRAHNEGDLIDAEKLERFPEWKDKVEKVSAASKKETGK